MNNLFQRKTLKVVFLLRIRAGYATIFLFVSMYSKSEINILIFGCLKKIKTSTLKSSKKAQIQKSKRMKDLSIGFYLFYVWII